MNKPFCISEARFVHIADGMRITRWVYTYRDAEGWEWIESLVKRERVRA